MKEAIVYHTEAEFRQWVEENLDKIGIKRVILSQEVCPDYVVEMQNGEVAKIEAELFAINFKYHKHDPSKADYILACYAKEQEVESVPVIAMNKLWIYEPSPSSPLPPEGPLSDDELALLGRIDFNGSLELSALCSGEFEGNQCIFLRLSPEKISSLPRGTIEDSIFNVISPEAKKYIKRYHHILIGTNISEKACSALESLTRRELIKIRPISIAAALYDGTLIKDDGWIPTEVYATPATKQYHGKKLIDWELEQIKKNVVVEQ